MAQTVGQLCLLVQKDLIPSCFLLVLSTSFILEAVYEYFDGFEQCLQCICTKFCLLGATVLLNLKSLLEG